MPINFNNISTKERESLRAMYTQAQAYVRDKGWDYVDRQAWGLVTDAVEYFMADTWYQMASAPYFLMKNKFTNYLKALPYKDRDTREWENYRDERWRYNLKKYRWENTHQRLVKAGSGVSEPGIGPIQVATAS